MSKLVSHVDAATPAADDPREPRVPASAARAPHVDWRQLASRLGDDDETAKRVLQHFVEQADAQLRRLGEAADSADSRAIGMEAHRLRGVLAWIGAEYAASVAADIEELCRAGHTGRAAELCEKLRQETESVVAAIRGAGEPLTG